MSIPRTIDAHTFQGLRGTFGTRLSCFVPSLRQVMGRAKTGFISRAPVVVVPCANKLRFESKYGAPAEKNARLPWWVVDSSFATLALILSAFEKGLAASFVGAIDDQSVIQVLSLPSDSSIIPLAIVPIGYKDPNESSDWKRANQEKILERRREFADVVRWDRW